MKKILVLTILILSAGLASSQPLFLPRNVQQALENGTRSESGAPGKNYWQNAADYSINISFDPTTLLVKGEETITYFNNSPDTLDKIIIRNYPDYYKKGISRNYPIDPADENEGVTMEELKLNGNWIIQAGHSGNAERDETNLIVHTGKTILPHSKSQLDIKWHYTVNRGSHVRTGLVDSTSFFIAYFFPRIAVYDDINGWDESHYEGMQEFYNDFGNFDVRITVPKGFIVWATGELQNESGVLDKRILDKLQQARLSTRITHVIDSNDYKKGTITSNNTSNTFHFKALDVSDFAFALSDHYLWDVTTVTDKGSGRKIVVQSAYDKSHTDYFDVIYISQRCVDIMCDTFPGVPFPYPQVTVFDGLDEMEYPMMVNDAPTSSWEEAVQLTSHEIFHSYFPFSMGINETQYAWMDEGWATLAESIISPYLHAPESEGIYRKDKYEEMAGTNSDAPMITNSSLLTGETYYSLSYGKPGLCYWVLKDMMGEEKFYHALHEFMRQWNGKHPTSYDFFNSFNHSGGENLDWFWEKWFFDFSYPDLGIKEVKTQSGEIEIIINQKGNLPVPVHLTISLNDGSVIQYHETARVWKDGKEVYVFTQKVAGEVISVTLGDIYTPDVNRRNNEWKR